MKNTEYRNNDIFTSRHETLTNLLRRRPNINPTLVQCFVFARLIPSRLEHPQSKQLNYTIITVDKIYMNTPRTIIDFGILTYQIQHKIQLPHSDKNR